MSQPFIFKGGNDQDVKLWINAVELYFRNNKIAGDDHIPFAFDHLSGRVTACLMSLTGFLSGFMQTTWVWDWTKLKSALTLMNEQIHSPTEEAGSELGHRLLAFGARIAWPFIQEFLDQQTHSMFHVFDHPRYEPCDAMTNRDRAMQEFPELSGYLRTWITALDSPSRTWNDGANFQPSRKVIRNLLFEFMRSEGSARLH
ncbi:hypothetical protein ACEPAH_8569 [Sanghuangporus vaninii]